MLTNENIKYSIRLSPLQEGIYYHHLLDPASSSYFTQTAFHIKGKLDVALFQQGFQQIIDRYDVLRAVFVQQDTMQPMQVILKQQEADFTYIDFPADRSIPSLIEKDRLRLFDPGKGNLLRVSLTRLGDDEYYLIWSHHHILMDGWCLSVIIEDFLAIYQGLVLGQRMQLPAVMPYRNYIQYLERIDHPATLQYWRNYLAGYETPVRLPVIQPNEDTPYQLEEQPFTLDKTLSGELVKLGRKCHVTLNTVIQSIWGILLAKYNNTHDVVFAAVVSGRPPEINGIEKMIGLFINTIPVRIQTAQDTTFSGLLKTVQQAAIAGLPHHYVQLADVQQQSELGIGLLNHVMIFENYPVAEKIQGEAGSSGMPLQILSTSGFEQSNYDLNITIYPGESITVKFSYNTNRYDRHTMERIQAQFITLAKLVSLEPDTFIRNLAWLPEEEVQELDILSALQDTAAPDASNIVTRFEQQARLNPDAIAVIHGAQHITYKELNEHANQVAHYLKEVHGIAKGDLVGLIAVRSAALITGLLGILKAGAGYVPIDAGYPSERIDHMTKDTGMRVLLTEDSINNAPGTYASTNPGFDIALSDTAYIIYTSGSTGTPKGVVVTHGNAAHFFAQVCSHYNSGPGSVMPFVASHSFDISLFQLLLPLLSGGTSLVVDRQTLDDLSLFSGLLQQATMIDTVPGVYNLLADFILDNELSNQFTHITQIFIGGDTIPDPLLKKLSAAFSRAAIIVTYGPTEGTIFCTSHTYEAGQLPAAVKGSWLGRPLPGSQIWILDKDQNRLPVGVTGEICIGGAGVAAGYHSQPELTAEKFIAHPYLPGARLYRTGDLGRWTAEGGLEFMGRSDTQVKIRGFRIEMGEIERSLLSHPLIREAVVQAREDAGGVKYLAAYLVSTSMQQPSEIRSYLSGKLPDYMIPLYFVYLPQLPLTSNGKVDRTALPEPGADDIGRHLAYQAAGNEMEARMVQIWEEVLGRTGISIHDNFFEVGGHSLKAVQLVSRIRKEFEVAITLRDIFSSPDLLSLTNDIVKAGNHAFTSIPRVAIQESYPLSHSQRRFWILSQFSDSSAAYNIPGFLLFEGEPQLDLMTRVLQYIVDRHESLRTVFRENENGEVRQYILPVASLMLEPAYMDISAEADPHKILTAIFSAEQHTGFDLKKGPLIRTRIVKVREHQFALFYTMHHIISDGWSMEVLSKEVIAAYNSFNEGKNPALAPLPLQYRDFAAWQASQLQEDAILAHEDYWLEQFSGALPVLDLPADKIRPAVKTHRGSSITIPLPASVITALTTLCRQEGATLFMGLLAGLNALFYRYTGQEDIIVGSPIAGREHKDLEGQIGLYINSLALRTRFNGKDGFIDLLRNVKAVLMDAYAHQAYPFDMLIAALALQKDMSRLPLFDIMVGMQNQVSTNVYDKSVGFEGLSLKPVEEMKQERSQFDLLFSFLEGPEQLKLSLTYNTDIYSEANVTALCTHFIQLLEQATGHPSLALDQLRYLSAGEERLLLYAFNDTVHTIKGVATLTARFEEQAALTPDNVALIHGDKRITYRELNNKVNQLSHYLRSYYNIIPGDRIAVVADKSELVIIGILGILKAGAVYVPVDPSYPAERIRYMLTGAAPKVVLTLSDHLFTLIDHYSGELFALDVQLDGLEGATDNPPLLAGPSDLAYIIYTSGSTGQPKGVMVKHESVVNMSLDQIRQFDIQVTDKVLQFASLSFDASVSEIGMALFSGATLVLADKATLTEQERFIACLQQQQITVVTLPPSYLQLLPETALSGLRVLITAGQEADRATALRYSRQLNYYNAYGPTEDAVCATIYKVDPNDPPAGSIPIGKPIANNQVYILDANHQPVPLGITGEIYIGGKGLATGYLDNPDLTAERFVPHPFLEGERVYRTGDQGKWLADGNIVFLGRNDLQVKIRGYRIELEEIQQALLLYPGIKEVVVQVRDKDNVEGGYLAAYLVAADVIAKEALDDHLAVRLPAYMTPAVYVQLDALPLTHNGKIDRKALPDPYLTGTGEEYVPPATPLEKQLAAMWAEVLGRNEIGRDDHFFTLGGHSLKAMQLLSRIRKELQVKIELNDLFSYATLQAQASFIQSAGHYTLADIPLAPIQDSYPLSHAQQRFWILSQFEQASMAYNVPGACLLEGSFDMHLFTKAVNWLCRRHESLRTAFKEDAGGNIRQYILDAATLTVTPAYTDLSGSGQQMEQLQDIFIAEQQTVFDLQQGPLISIRVVKLDGAAHALFYTMHHIISDGWSLQVLIKEITTVYNALQQGLSPDLPELPVQYKDFTLWQAAGREDEQLQAHENYWRTHLSGDIPVLQLPVTKTRPAVKTHHGSTVSATFSADTVQGLLRLCRDEEASLFMGLLSGLKALFHLYTGQEDIILGTPIAGRTHPQLEMQIGLYLNTLALRTRFKATDSFRTLLQQEKEILLEAYTHQAYPFDLLVEQLSVKRDTSRSPLFDVLVIMQNYAAAGDSAIFSGLQMRSLDGMQRITSQFDLELSFAETGEELQLLLNYNTDIYSPEFAQNLCVHLERLLAFAVAHPETPVSKLEILSGDEREQQLKTFNNTAIEYAGDKTIVDLFDQQVQVSRDKTAIVFEDHVLTYGELQAQAERVAAHLVNTLQVKRGDLVVLMMERSELMMAGMLGILKAGAAYVPVDPSYPQERISYILEDSGAKVMLTGKDTVVPIGYTGEALQLDVALKATDSGHFEPSAITPNDLCYVIYTSGSTGNPKGVMIRHSNVVNFFTGMDQVLPLNNDDCLLALTSTSFDISVLELLWTLCRGIEVVIHPSDVPGNLDRYIATEQQALDFSLFFFSSYEHNNTNKYGLLQECVRYADTHGFKAIWTPERHFHEFGGLYPNPSVISAALAVSTQQIAIRCGSVVAPLHDPIRIAEEWSVVDNLSGGRVGLSFAAGWNANDFVLGQTAYEQRNQRMYEQVAEVKHLWEGGSVTRTNGFGQTVTLQSYPRPVQQALPVWVTAAGSVDTFISAGAIGANVLTHLLGQDIEELTDKIRQYRESLARHGHEGPGIVTVMIHTYLGTDADSVNATAEEPFIAYLKSSIGLSRIMLEASGLKEEEISEELKYQILKNSYQRYANSSALIGTRSSCSPLVEKLRHIGVNEIACLVDFGISEEQVLAGLNTLNELKEQFSRATKRHHKPITVLQSTPSFIRLAMEEGYSAQLLGSLRMLLLGGEALPAGLLDQLQQQYDLPVYNMYGPTETTIWSCVCGPSDLSQGVSIGRPIANTQVYILNSFMQQLPVGVAGELYIGGDGVAAGYLHRPELTAARFVADPFRGEGLLYRTGDLARWLPDGRLEYLGRLDEQVKIRGYRIEPGEIEAALTALEAIQEAVVIPDTTTAGDTVLVACMVAEKEPDVTVLRSVLSKRLPAYMIPSRFITLKALPLTPNGKTDRKALKELLQQVEAGTHEYVAPDSETEQKLVKIWEAALGANRIGVTDNFFTTGGQSLSGMRMISMVRNEFRVTIGIADLFNAQTIRELGILIDDILRVNALKVTTARNIEKEEIIL